MRNKGKQQDQNPGVIAIDESLIILVVIENHDHVCCDVVTLSSLFVVMFVAPFSSYVIVSLSLNGEFPLGSLWWICLQFHAHPLNNLLYSFRGLRTSPGS